MYVPIRLYARIVLRSTFYSYFKESFGDEYHMYNSFHCTHVIATRNFQSK